MSAPPAPRRDKTEDIPMTEIPLPTPPKPRASATPSLAGDAPRMPASPTLAQRTAPIGGVGAFFAEHRAQIDARKTHIARVGMLPEHAQALAMPDLDPRTELPEIVADDLPAPVSAADYEAPALPKKPGAPSDITEA